MWVFVFTRQGNLKRRREGGEGEAAGNENRGNFPILLKKGAPLIPRVLEGESAIWGGGGGGVGGLRLD